MGSGHIPLAPGQTVPEMRSGPCRSPPSVQPHLCAREGQKKEKVVRDLSQLRPQAQVVRGSAARCGRALGLLSNYRQKESLPLLIL